MKGTGFVVKTEVKVTLQREANRVVIVQKDTWEMASKRDANKKALLNIVIPQIMQRADVKAAGFTRRDIKKTELRFL